MSVIPRCIPVLQLDGTKLVKTVQFGKSIYLGDPINAVKIFNDKGADELAILDIKATKNKSAIQWALLADIATEAFMPLSYGGGIQTVEDAKRLFGMGFEKVILNSSALINPNLISEIAQISGNQSVAVCIDYKADWLGKTKVYTKSGSEKQAFTPLEWAKKVELLGAGEIILQSIVKDGTWSGYDYAYLQTISEAVGIPVIPLGGAANAEDIKKAFEFGAHGIAAASMYVFSAQGKGILIRYFNTLDRQ